MKARSIYKISLAVLVATLQTLIGVASAAPSPAPAKTPPTSKAPPTPVEPEVPQSVFNVPGNPKDGKDPFFPTSPRPYVPGTVRTTNTTVKPITVDFVLTGISPFGEKPYAMINGRTFGNNEEGDIPTTAGKVHIKCVEIKADSVIIEFRGARQELMLRKGL